MNNDSLIKFSNKYKYNIYCLKYFFNKMMFIVFFINSIYIEFLKYKMENLGKSWKILENLGKSWKIYEK